MKEVIKFLGKTDDLVWIYPKTTISKDATVIVDMGYQAIMVRNGEIDIPYLTGTNKAFNEKQSKFLLFNNNKYISDCSIYYFNKSREVSSREWGTKYPIKYFDKSYKLELSMRGHGTYKLYIENPRLLLKSFRIENTTIIKLESSIKDMVISKLSETIARVLTNEEYDLLTIHAYYESITAKALTALNVSLEEFGFSVYDLRISNLTIVEEEHLEALKVAKFKSAVLDTIKNPVCANCNTNLDINMKFCPNCGKNLIESEFGE